MDGTASPPHVRRRSVAWILWSAVGMCVCSTIALVLWLFLPRWAPDLVIRHSPFVDPVLRAMGARLRSEPLPAAFRHEVFNVRVSDWGMDMVPGVMVALESSEASCRTAALGAWCLLSERKENRPPPGLVDALCRHAIDDPDGHSRMMAIYGLQYVVSLRTKQVWLAGLKDPQDMVRELTVRVCGNDQQMNQEILAAVAEKLRDPAPTVRRASAHVLWFAAAKLWNPGPEVRRASVPTSEYSVDIRTVDALIAALGIESEPDIAVSQIGALGEIRDRRATETLLQIVRRPTPSIKQAKLVVQALESLRTIDQSAAMPLWIAALTHEHAFVRLSAVNRLVQTNDPSITSELLKRVFDTNAYVLTQTVWTLAIREDPGVIDQLLDAYEHGCCRPGSTDWEKDMNGLETDARELPPLRSALSLLDRMPFTDTQRKRWEAMRDKPSPESTVPLGHRTPEPTLLLNSRSL